MPLDYYENGHSFCFAQASVPQKWEFFYETLLRNAQGMWKVAQKISKSFVNNSYGSSIVTVSAMPLDYYENGPKFTYENPAFSTLTNHHSHKTGNFPVKFLWVMLS